MSPEKIELVKRPLDGMKTVSILAPQPHDAESLSDPHSSNAQSYTRDGSRGYVKALGNV